MVRVLNPYGDSSGIGESIANLGQMMFGDTLTPALKREQMRLTGGKADEQERMNTAAAKVMDLISTNPQGVAGVMQNPQFQSFILGASNVDPKNLGIANRVFTTNNPNNSLTGEAVARAMLGAGDSAASTPLFTKRDQDMRSADNRYNTDQRTAADRYSVDRRVAEDRYQFENKPIDAMVPTLDKNAIGPFLPGQEPKTMSPGFIPQGKAVEMGAQPIVKGGFSVTTNPDGTVSVSQGNTNMPKPTEQQIRASGIAQEMAPGIAVLNQAFEGGKSVSTGGLIGAEIMKSPLLTDLAQRAGVVNPDDQMILGSMMQIMNNLYIKTGAARTASEDINELVSMIPLQSDTPERRELKRAAFNQKAMGAIMASRDPMVRDQLSQAMQGIFKGSYPRAKELSIGGSSGRTSSPNNADPLGIR